MKKDVCKVTLIMVCIYNIIPILNNIFPITIIYTFLSDLWIINLIGAFISSICFCKKHGFQICIAFLIAGLFIPTMYIFYNSTAFIFVVIYFGFSILGSGIGTFIYRKTHRNKHNL